MTGILVGSVLFKRFCGSLEMENERKTFCYIDKDKDEVRKEYKRYKKRKPPPDFSEVIDFNNPLKYENKLKKLDVDISEDANTTEYCSVGLKHPSRWAIYELRSCPGFIVIPNPFLSYGAQSYWIKKSLTDYTKDPYPCNLDVLMKLDKQNGLWDISHQKSSDNSFINQLRWVHMGYHFDYNIVDYKAKQYFGFPNDFAKLTKTVASVFHFPDYIAETGIINYYPEGSSMGGHTDHYEEELCQPLISFSFGQSAVYLIGGESRDIKPEAIWVRSGDVMLMTGPSRIAFHAVPCIVTKPAKTAPSDIGTCPLVIDNDYKEEHCICDTTKDYHHIWKSEIDDSWKDFSDYLSSTRININIRQVHKYNKELKDKMR